MGRWAQGVTTFASGEGVVMAVVTDVRVRQPRENDVVGDRFVVAGIGARVRRDHRDPGARSWRQFRRWKGLQRKPESVGFSLKC